MILPVLVVLRLGVTLNAYFYITWMMGAAFFMVSPAVAQAVFAEGVRAHSDLRSVVVKALRVIAILLVPAMVVMIVGGKFILGLFGPSYAAVGYGLLILLAISALPDAVSNVAVVVFRVTQRLGYSTALNLGILVVTLVRRLGSHATARNRGSGRGLAGSTDHWSDREPARLCSAPQTGDPECAVGRNAAPPWYRTVDRTSRAAINGTGSATRKILSLL